MKVSRENALPVGLDSGLGQIRDWIDGGEPTPAAARRGDIHSLDIHDDYIRFMSRFKGDYGNLKLAFDLSNGMSCLFAHEVFGEEPSYIFDTIDGRFPNHDPNPLVPKNVEPLKELVRRTGADVGVIYDGDADRVMFVDDYGAELHTWKVGRAFAAPKLREIDGLWGGELAGHYYFKDFFYSDSGLLSSLIVLRIVSALKKKGVRFSEQIDAMTAYCNSGEINFRLDDKPAAMKAVCEHFSAAEKPLKVMDFDGYRLEFRDWWFNIRPSNTEPYLRFICEAHTPGMLEQKVKEAQELLESRFGAVRS